jgi:hypothetical protein
VPGLVAMSQTVVGQCQERPVRWQAHSAPGLDRFRGLPIASSHRPARYSAATSVFRQAGLGFALTPRTPISASRTGTPGSAGASGPSTQAQAILLAVQGLIAPPKRSSSAAHDACQPARSPDPTRTSPH